MNLADCFSLLTTDEPRARGQLVQAFAEARSRGDEATAFQAATGMLLAINLDFVDFRGVRQWCERFAAGWTPDVAEQACIEARAGRSGGLRVCAAAVTWPSLEHTVVGTDARFRAAAASLAEGLRVPNEASPEELVLLAKCLLDYHSQQMDTYASARLMALINEQIQLSPPSATTQSRWWFVAMNYHAYYGEAEAAAEARKRLQSLIDANDLHDVRYFMLTLDMHEWVKTGQMQRAERGHREIDALLPGMRAGHVPHGLHAQATYLACRGDHAAALARIDRLLAICHDLEVPERDQGVYRGRRSYVLSALHRHDEAIAELDGLRESQLGTQGDVLAVIRLFAESARELDAGDGHTPPSLPEALAGARRLSFNRFLFTIPTLAARLCQAALDAGIEPEFVRATIRARMLPAPDRTRPDWPWRLRVRALGALTVERDDQPLRWSGKTPRKPLELLALLAARGGGPIDPDTLIDALWPSLEAEAPRASLEMAVSRLRKLLDLPDAVLVTDGAVALDPNLVWCDTDAFERLADRLQAALGAHPPQSAASIERTARSALGLYGHALLGGEAVEGLLRMARERLAMAFHRLVHDWGSVLEAQGRWSDAVALYERALARDVLAEPTYRALMRAHLARGERAEAIRAYRRCRELLVSVLGTEPSDETRRLYDAARAAEA